VAWPPDTSHFANIPLVSSRFAKYSESEGPSTLHIISRKKLLTAAEEHEDLVGPLDVWYRIAKPAGWTSLEDVRRDFPTPDGVGEYTVFNIKGNEYRLISLIFYRSKMLFIRDVITHAEYDKGRWKK
jgi:mRNA interferase HigB